MHVSMPRILRREVGVALKCVVLEMELLNRPYHGIKLALLRPRACACAYGRVALTKSLITNISTRGHAISECIIVGFIRISCILYLSH